MGIFFDGASYLALASLFLAAIALGLSVSLSYSTRRTHRHTTLEKRLTALEADALELRDKIDATYTYAKKKYHRDQVRDHRAAKANGTPDPDTDPEGWKKAMMRQHVLNKGVS